MNPFLMRFAVHRRVRPESENRDYFYDESVDMVRWKGEPDQPLAIDRHGNSGPSTKKKDIEKGEDQKDRRMWE